MTSWPLDGHLRLGANWVTTLKAALSVPTPSSGSLSRLFWGELPRTRGQRPSGHMTLAFVVAIPDVESLSLQLWPGGAVRLADVSGNSL